MDNNKFPTVPKELLDELEKRFPDRLPPTPVELEDYLYLQGQQAVVRLIRHQFNLQNQNILEN
jgi:hypothetical protein